MPPAILADQVQEQVVLRIGVPLVLAEALRLLDPDLAPAVRPPLGLALQVLVHPVLSEQPLALARVAGKHPALDVEDARHVDVEVDRHRAAFAVAALERIDEVEVRDLRERRGRVPLAGGIVRARRAEAGVADQQARHLVVAEVIDRRRGQDQVGPGPAQGLGDPPARIVIVEDRQVAELEADGTRPRSARQPPAPPPGGSPRSPRSRARRCRSRPGVIVAIVTAHPASRSKASVPAHWNSTSSGWACMARTRVTVDMANELQSRILSGISPPRGHSIAAHGSRLSPLPGRSLPGHEKKHRGKNVLACARQPVYISRQRVR